MYRLQLEEDVHIEDTGREKQGENGEIGADAHVKSGNSLQMYYITSKETIVSGRQTASIGILRTVR